MNTIPIISIDNVSKSFLVGGYDVPVLKEVTFNVEKGDFCIIFGPSGCGKSTLLHTILGLEEPSTGIVTLFGNNLYRKVTSVLTVGSVVTPQTPKNEERFDEDERSDVRKKHIGMVYQQPNWIKSLTVVENTAFPLQLLGHSKAESIVKAMEFLKMVEMTEFAQYIPTELSSGQQQRVSLARALVTNPEIIIADEPTGNLDYESGQSLMQLLTHLNAGMDKTILMVTHDLEYLQFAKTSVKMFNGRIVGIYKGASIKKMKGKRGYD